MGGMLSTVSFQLHLPSLLWCSIEFEFTTPPLMICRVPILPRTIKSESICGVHVQLLVFFKFKH